MKVLPPHIDECVSALLKAFPVEDVWLLDRDDANECGLDTSHALIVAVSDGESAHERENEARALFQQKSIGRDFSVFVFPLSTIERIPRPLLVKMALTSGERVYCG